ncbi:MAG TPA: hypothetical protein VGX68_03960 [Thermoanaerobaculia bacterium]|jgi:hypothetical protein|nr:hypothetical protein [Thermoanaerobaculia bacterium]
MSEIKLSEGAREGLLAVDAGAHLAGSHRHGTPRYRLSGRFVDNPEDFEELRRHRLIDTRPLPPAGREVDLTLTEKGRREAARLRSE